MGIVSRSSDGTALPSAMITVVENGRSATSDSSGAFRISDLPEGRYTPQARFTGIDPKTETVAVPATGTVSLNPSLGEEIVHLEAFAVEGYREGRARALVQKQKQTNISDIIAADAIGNLPDRNVAEAVRRNDIAEYIYAAYAMASVTYDRLTVLGGLRWEKTEPRVRATEARFQGGTFLGHFPTSGKTSYDQIFPNLQAVYCATDRFVARAAISRTIGRPAYEDARPLSNFNNSSLGSGALDPVIFPNSGSLTIGNPQLQPFGSQNYDLSLEWYVGGSGIVSLAAFRKDIDDPIFTYSETQRNVVYNTIGLETLNLTGRRDPAAGPGRKDSRDAGGDRRRGDFPRRSTPPLLVNINPDSPHDYQA